MIHPVHIPGHGFLLLVNTKTPEDEDRNWRKIAESTDNDEGEPGAKATGGFGATGGFLAPVAKAPGSRVPVEAKRAVNMHRLTLAALLLAALGTRSLAQEKLPASQRVPTPAVPAAPRDADTVLPINLATALQLAKVRPLEVQLAARRTQLAAAGLEQARVLWLPTVYLGVDYFRHDGQLQDIAGIVFGTSRSSFLAGVGPSLVFAVTDAIYAPLAARQIVRARQADEEAVGNDAVLAVARAYFDVQQARGELAGALDIVRRTDDLLRRTERLSPGLVPPPEVSRVRAERERRRQIVETFQERWISAGAELTRLLRLSPTSAVRPEEPPHLMVELINPDCPIDDLVAAAWVSRPELAARRAILQAALERTRQERWRPLLPSLLVRGNATNPAASLSTGVFGGGRNDEVARFSARNSIDVQLLWEVRNLGLGNRAAIRKRRTEADLASLEEARTRELIAAEVMQARAEVRSAVARVKFAEAELKNALESFEKNLEGLGQTRRAGELLILVVRPLEAVASLQALAQAYSNFYAASADANRAQFRLYRALGKPAHLLVQP